MPDLNDYPVIQFTDKSSNFNKRKRCLKINDYLVIAYCDVDENAESPIKIYKLPTGLPLINVMFNDPKDAINVANWIIETFGEYFSIWDTYPEADIFSMTKWTVPEGLQKYEAIRLFSQNKKGNPDDLKLAYQQAGKYTHNWTNEHLR